MSRINKKAQKILIFLIVCIVLVIALILSKFAYSFLGANVDDDVIVEGEVTASGDTLIFSKGSNLSLKANADSFNPESGNLVATTRPSVKLIANTKTKEASANYYAGFTINENTYQYSTSGQAEVILSIEDGAGINVSGVEGLEYVTVNGVSGFDITGKTGTFNIDNSRQISATPEEPTAIHTWTFTVTFINYGETDQTINETANLDMDIILQKEPLHIIDMTLADYIKTSVYIEDGEKGLYLHDADLTNGANDGSYRYAGANPDNYVCFGYDDATKAYASNWCPYDNLYRIIGVFNELNVDTNVQEEMVKLIKAYEAGESVLGKAKDGTAVKDSNYYKGQLTTIPGYYKSGSSSNQSNIWTNSTLNTENLNGTYLTNLGEYVNKIATTRWHIGGGTADQLYNVTPTVAYQNEIGTPVNNTTDDAKVGLMYVSEYGYAAISENWTTTLNNYNIAKKNNWMYLGVREWTITSDSSNSNNAFYVDSIGFMNGYYVYNNTFMVRPTFSLNSSIKFAGGTGTASDPYRIN